MLLTYVGPFDEVEVDGMFELVKAGVPVEVPDEIAGRAPNGHRADVDEDGNSLHDPGEGLLAQPSNWRLVEPTETAAKRKAREKSEADVAAGTDTKEHSA